MPRLVVPIFSASAEADFALRVEFAVQRQNQRGIVGDLQIVGRDLDALRRDPFDFVDQMARGSSTTPLPMTESLPGRTMPDGSSASL